MVNYVHHESASSFDIAVVCKLPLGKQLKCLVNIVCGYGFLDSSIFSVVVRVVL